MKHTKLPLDLPWEKHPKSSTVVVDAKGQTVCTTACYSEIQDHWGEHADYIVHAANNYPALVEALKFYAAGGGLKAIPQEVKLDGHPTTVFFDEYLLDNGKKAQATLSACGESDNG